MEDLEEFLFARAMEHDSPKLLFRLAGEYLLSSRVVRPGVILLLRRVAAARARARTETWSRVRHLLTDRRCAELDLLLVPDAYLGRTPLAWLGVGPTSSSPTHLRPARRGDLRPHHRRERRAPPAAPSLTSHPTYRDRGKREVFPTRTHHVGQPSLVWA